MKILSIPFKTIYKCDACGCEFEIEQDDVYANKITRVSFDGESTILSRLYCKCPFCNTEIDIVKR